MGSYPANGSSCIPVFHNDNEGSDDEEETANHSADEVLGEKGREKRGGQFRRGLNPDTWVGERVLDVTSSAVEWVGKG